MAKSNGKDGERERFNGYLDIDGSDPTCIEEKLSTLPREFMRQTQRRAGLMQMRIDAARQAEALKNEVYLELRKQKDSGDKSLTEDVISARIKSDEGYLNAAAEVSNLELAEVVQSGRLDALRMLERCTLSLATSLATERRLSK